MKHLYSKCNKLNVHTLTEDNDNKSKCSTSYKYFLVHDKMEKNMSPKDAKKQKINLINYS